MSAVMQYGPFRPRLQPGLVQQSVFVDPSSTGTLTLWLDGDVGTYSDTGLATPQSSDAGAVGGWASRTGSNHVLQATSGAQPTLRTNVVNGHSVIRFDGSDWLQSAALGATDAQPNTLFFVGKKAANDSVQNNVLMGRVSTGNTNRNHIGYQGGTSNTIRMSATSSVTKSSVTVASWNIIAAVFNGASSKLYANGGAATTGNPGSTGISGFTIGADADGTTSPLTGDLACCLAFSNALTDAELNNVFAYLGTLYGITVTAVS